MQLPCPPTDVYDRPEVFGLLDEMVQAGKLRHYGVSVERVEEALKAIEFPNVQSVQIILCIFRRRPAELFFIEAQKRKVGIVAQVPLASGLLSGKVSSTRLALQMRAGPCSGLSRIRGTHVRRSDTGAQLTLADIRWCFEG